MTFDAARVLGVLADLDAATDQQSATANVSVEVDLVQWVPLSYTNLLHGESGWRALGMRNDDSGGFDPTDVTQRIYKVARLRGSDRSEIFRVGWLWLAGNHPQHGPVVAPLVSVAAKIPKHGRLDKFLDTEVTHPDPKPAGDPVLTDLIADPHERDRLAAFPDLDESWKKDPAAAPADDLLEHYRTGTARAWIDEVASAVGCSIDSVIGPLDDPADLQRRNGMAVVVAAGLYIAPNDPALHRADGSTLRWWMGQALEGTAFSAVYDDTFDIALEAADDVDSGAGGNPVVLNASQRAAVEAVRHRRLTVLSGPPGTGKTHTIAAVAFDHRYRNKSVLVVAPTQAAVAVLTSFMHQIPGLDPVVFGSPSERLELADRLDRSATDSSTDVDHDPDREQYSERLEELDRVADEASRRYHDIAIELEGEVAGQIDQTELALAQVEAPGLFVPGADIDAAFELSESAIDADNEDASRRRRRKAREAFEQLAKISNSPAGVDALTLSEHVLTAAKYRFGLERQLDGGLDLDDHWEPLRTVLELKRRRIAEACELVTIATAAQSRSAMAAVADALRADHGRRRALLDGIGAAAIEPMLAAQPLWVATIRDVDALLPMHADMFDLVIIDEASHIDQTSAAPALLRARSALIVGDPRQLRHASSVSSHAVGTAIAAAGLSEHPVAAQLDVRHNSIFDAAASVQPPLQLDEHYRSMPHVIGFAAQQFYGDRLGVATRHPRNDRVDCIDVVEVDGAQDESGVNAREVATIVDLIRSRELTASRSVGVITPFGAQAAALETAVLAAFTEPEIERLDLRVGVVQGMQGCERDVTYLSTCLDDRASPEDVALIDDPAMFNVMVTRARRQVTVVTSAGWRAPHLLAAYLDYARRPPEPDMSSDPERAWPSHVVTELRAAGLTVSANYRVGDHVVDAVVGDGDGALGLICGVHRDGPEAHLDRQLELMDLGWNLCDVFESRWTDRLAVLAVELASSTL